MLKHGASPSSSTAQVQGLSTLFNRVVDICCKYDNFASLRDLPQDSAQDSARPVLPESSAYDPAITRSGHSTSPPALKHLKPLTAPIPCPATLLVTRISRSMRLIVQPDLCTRNAPLPRVCTCPTPSHHATTMRRLTHSAAITGLANAHTRPHAATAEVCTRSEIVPIHLHLSPLLVRRVRCLRRLWKPSAPQLAHAPRSDPPSEADQVTNNAEADIPKIKKPPRSQFNRSTCLIKGCTTTACTCWWMCPDTCVYTSDRGLPDVNPHRSNCVCDLCQERHS